MTLQWYTLARPHDVVSSQEHLDDKLQAVTNAVQAESVERQRGPRKKPFQADDAPNVPRVKKLQVADVMGLSTETNAPSWAVVDNALTDNPLNEENEKSFDTAT